MYLSVCQTDQHSFIISYHAFASFYKKKKNPSGWLFHSLAGRFSGRFGFRNAAVNLFGELKPDSCVNRVKTSKHHLVHKSWERLRGTGRLGPPLSSAALKVTWQLTSVQAACPRPHFWTCLSFCPLYFYACALLFGSFLKLAHGALLFDVAYFHIVAFSTG